MNNPVPLRKLQTDIFKRESRYFFRGDRRLFAHIIDHGIGLHPQLHTKKQVVFCMGYVLGK